jgi:hypothetical protein
MATAADKQNVQVSENEKKTRTPPTINWQDEKMVSSYSNMCNVASSREEIMLLFGMNQTWNNTKDEMTVELNNRIILNPMAAKRLLALLSRTISEYEKNTGKTE